jgi:hypothetical protein
MTMLPKLQTKRTLDFKKRNLMTRFGCVHCWILSYRPRPSCRCDFDVWCGGMAVESLPCLAVVCVTCDNRL